MSKTVAKYQKYAEYKNSGINGLDVIPVHWDLSKVKYLASYLNGYAFKPEHWAEFGVPIIRIQNLSNQNAEINRTEFCPLERYRVKAGDILISWSATLDVYIWNKEDAWLNQHIFKVSINKSFIDSQFFYWTAKWFMGELNESSHGSTMQHLTTDKFGSFNVPLPDIGEQKQIANFLDHETAQIDTLIAKQEKLIELLKEKRQAVISHAVTKGLNSDVTMKDSGVEWLGQVPEHWAVAKLAYRYEVLLGKMLDESKITGNYLGKYLRNTDVQWGRINNENLPEMDFRPHETERYLVKQGDLLVCEGGEIGRCAIWETEEPCFYQKALHRLRAYSNQDSHKFMFYVLFDSVHRERFISGAGKATIAHLPAETFKQYRFAFPPKNEQDQITEYLDTMSKAFDEIESKALEQIDLLKERRTALISSAVTGKIDVRHHASRPSGNDKIQMEGI